ncbi:hypothetical protein FACS1894191_6220 [Clostridia bacterium]|nr:hypothetical protein FACS1894191_6220 [Clostridia bacterium]
MKRPKQRKKNPLPKIITIILALGLGATSSIAILRYLNFKTLTPATALYKLPETTITYDDLPYPDFGPAAIAIDGKPLTKSGESIPRPIASTAKIILALSIIKNAPIGEDGGEPLTITAKDVELYNWYAAHNGSNSKVTLGGKLTIYEALEAVLLKSSNNLADSLAIKAFGSLENYKEYAEKMLESLGIKNTEIGPDASGYSALTTSTAEDLALLGYHLLKEPVLAEIVAKKSATIPMAGEILNTNTLLDGEIIGIKTGTAPEAGSVFVLGSKSSEKIITIAVMNAKTQDEAQSAAKSLLTEFNKKLKTVELVKKGDLIGVYRPSWTEETVEIIAAESLSLPIWPGEKPEAVLEATAINLNEFGKVGNLKIIIGETTYMVPIKTEQELPKPSLLKKILR